MQARYHFSARIVEGVAVVASLAHARTPTAAEARIWNPQVVGSSPTRGANSI